jgi:molybdopterin synthase sulfur carrier subunit
MLGSVARLVERLADKLALSMGVGRLEIVTGLTWTPMSKAAPPDRRPSVRLLLHGAFRGFAGGARDVTLDASTMREALDGLVRAHPTMAERLRDERGTLRPHLALFINQDDARLLGWEDAPLHDGDIVHVIPALSGG